ncbi:MAG: SRPBCC domain-containing protein [Anaerolineaceae bacterium]|nr:SRPBCC domain-containing protein [Anaerolineaceae bacterium]
MSEQNYAALFAVDQSPEEVFAAVINPRGWWSKDIEGDTDKLGGEFRFRAKDAHLSTQKITEFVPNQKVVWHVTESQINFVEDKAEWTDTEVIFEIAKQGDKTELRFTHVGLVPAIECYNECSNAWSLYINGSLRSLITTGKGQLDLTDNAAEALSLKL